MRNKARKREKNAVAATTSCEKNKKLKSFVPQSFDGQEQTVNGPKGSGT